MSHAVEESCSILSCKSLIVKGSESMLNFMRMIPNSNHVAKPRSPDGREKMDIHGHEPDQNFLRRREVLFAQLLPIV